MYTTSVWLPHPHRSNPQFGSNIYFMPEKGSQHVHQQLLLLIKEIVIDTFDKWSDKRKAGSIHEIHHNDHNHDYVSYHIVSLIELDTNRAETIETQLGRTFSAVH